MACMLLLGLRVLAEAAAPYITTTTTTTTTAAGSVLLVLGVSTFAGVVSTLARPLLSASSWEALERRCRLLRYYCYAGAKAMVFSGMGWPPGVSAYLLTPGMLLLEGVLVSWGSAVSVWRGGAAGVGDWRGEAAGRRGARGGRGFGIAGVSGRPRPWAWAWAWAWLPCGRCAALAL